MRKEWVKRDDGGHEAREVNAINVTTARFGFLRSSIYKLKLKLTSERYLTNTETVKFLITFKNKVEGCMCVNQIDHAQFASLNFNSDHVVSVLRSNNSVSYSPQNLTSQYAHAYPFSVKRHATDRRGTESLKSLRSCEQAERLRYAHHIPCRQWFHHS
jgi:hypothetical protein